MFIICKNFKFSAAHSVYTQSLLKKWSGQTYPKCRRLPGHGHNYKVKLCISSNKLDKSQMVTDFGHLRWFKNFIDTFLDHKLIISTNDKAFKLMMQKLGMMKGNTITMPSANKGKLIVNASFMDKNYRIKSRSIDEPTFDISDFLITTFTEFTFKNAKSIEAELYQRFMEGVTFIKTSPTSENLAKLLFEFAQKTLKELKVSCHSVTVQETPSSYAIYTVNDG